MQAKTVAHDTSPFFSGSLTMCDFRCGPRRTNALLALLALVAVAVVAAGPRPTRKLYYNKEFPQVSVFAGIDSGDLEVTAIPSDEFRLTLMVKNLSGAPLSVEIPSPVAAVQVLPQQLPPFGQNPNGQGSFFNPMGSQPGNAQPVSGSITSGANVNRRGLPPAINFPGIFSVGSGETAHVTLKTVCMAKGRANPTPRMAYKLVPFEEVSQSEELREALQMYAAGPIDRQVMQAVAWHVMNGLSWDELRALRVRRLGGMPSEPLFSERQLSAAQDLFQHASARIREQPAKPRL